MTLPGNDGVRQYSRQLSARTLQVVSKPGRAPDERNVFSANAATARGPVPVLKCALRDKQKLIAGEQRVSQLLPRRQPEIYSRILI